MAAVTGGCACGAVRFSAQGQPDRVGICHCLDCRKHHGAVFYAAAIYPEKAVTLTGETLDHAGRHSCKTCGSSVFARTENEIELHLGAMDMPDQFTPEYECWTLRREAWLSPVPGARQYSRDRQG
ncbi:GFA family protein [Cognatishimia sp. MH4019]|uniref:GFA family protein n=1 Tax=Cognatishimia sp. MH4019 TaxID=2854030 RepID=UPI001CD3CA36|nr:GFA family protein [Cognatishimia sp. MH4019]